MLFDSKHRLPATKLPHVGEPQDVRYCSLNPYQHCLYPSLHTYFISFLYLFPFFRNFFSLSIFFFGCSCLHLLPTASPSSGSLQTPFKLDAACVADTVQH